MENPMLWSFGIFLLLFLSIGLYAAMRGRNTQEDYYLASRTVPPWAVGLSAIATNNSGYMFIGMVGYTYLVGLSAVWLGLGLVLGDFLSSLVIHKRFTQAARTTGEVSYAGVLSTWRGTDYRVLRRLIGLITVVFLLAYASAQFGAANKMLQAIGEETWFADAGAYVGFLIVLLYSLWGGVRASIWTDVAQAFVMILAIVISFSMLFDALGGFQGAVEAWRQIPGFLDVLKTGGALPGVLGGMLFALSWGFAGFNVTGQPHIMSRFMTLDRAEQYARVRPWYYTFYVLMYVLVIAVGMLARIYLPELADPEQALPAAAGQLLAPVVAGALVAGVFAAAMSTADSQIITCSVTFARDFAPGRFGSSPARKAATLLSAGFALMLALVNHASIFDLVITAWSAMGSAFGPLVLVYALGQRPAQRQAIAMVLTGLAVAIVWRQLGLNNMVYEGMPAVLASLAAFWLIKPGVFSASGLRVLRKRV